MTGAERQRRYRERQRAGRLRLAELEAAAVRQRAKNTERGRRLRARKRAEREAERAEAARVAVADLPPPQAQALAVAPAPVEPEPAPVVVVEPERPPVEPVALADWCAALRVTQGEHVGQALAVLPWQRRYLDAVEALDGGELALTMGSGGGKSTLAAAIAAAAVAGPLAKPRGLVMVVASSFGQARLVFDHALAFLRPVIEADPARWRVLDSDKSAVIHDRATGAELRAREATARTLHGAAPALIVADEPAQWQRAQAEATYAALRSRLGKIPGSALLAIGTRPEDADHWFARMLDRSGIVHAAPRTPTFSTWRVGARLIHQSTTYPP
ncbi:MAG: terminase family protein [Spirochaetaceae bacterium]|nr:terminase family protein [Spirochaetaceae bacterium]